MHFLTVFIPVFDDVIRIDNLFPFIFHHFCRGGRIRIARVRSCSLSLNFFLFGDWTRIGMKWLATMTPWELDPGEPTGVIKHDSGRSEEVISVLRLGTELEWLELLLVVDAWSLWTLWLGTPERIWLELLLVVDAWSLRTDRYKTSFATWFCIHLIQNQDFSIWPRTEKSRSPNRIILFSGAPTAAIHCQITKPMPLGPIEIRHTSINTGFLTWYQSGHMECCGPGPVAWSLLWRMIRGTARIVCLCARPNVRM